MNARARARSAWAVAILVTVGACGGPAPAGPLPTVAEAEQLLAQVVGLAERRDFEGLCAIGDGNCERSLDTAGRDAVPEAPPAVVGVRFLPTTRNGDQVSIGGVILELCGTDGRGNPYHSEMLVFRDGASLRAINPVYWGNTTIAEGASTPASFQPTGSC